jgi:hypothetical protein
VIPFKRQVVLLHTAKVTIRDRRTGDSVGISEGKGRSKLVAAMKVVAAIAAAAIANPGLVSFG